MFLIRYLLIGLAVYLIVRSFHNFKAGTGNSDKIKEPDEAQKANGKKVSKSVGEYVDYEEIKKE